MGLNHACNTCGGSIDFAPEHTGLQVACPHCGMTTVLVASSPHAPPPFGGPPQAPPGASGFGDPYQHPTGGYPQPQISHGPQLYHQPARGGISTGGIIGIVVGVFLAVGLIVMAVVMLGGKDNGSVAGVTGGGSSSEITEKEDFTKMHAYYREKIFPLEVKAGKLIARLDDSVDDDEALDIMNRMLENLVARTIALKLLDSKTPEVSSLNNRYVRYCETGQDIWRRVINALEDGDQRGAENLIFDNLKAQTDLLAEWVKDFNRMSGKYALPDLESIIKDML